MRYRRTKDALFRELTLSKLNGVWMQRLASGTRVSGVLRQTEWACVWDDEAHLERWRIACVMDGFSNEEVSP